MCENHNSATNIAQNANPPQPRDAHNSQLSNDTTVTPKIPHNDPLINYINCIPHPPNLLPSRLVGYPTALKPRIPIVNISTTLQLHTSTLR